MNPDLMQLSGALWTVGALRAADELGVLTRLESGPVDAEALAAEHGLSARGVAVLLDALHGIGVAHRVGAAGYVAAAGTGASVRELSDAASLTETIRDGRPEHACDTPSGAARLYPDMAGPIGVLGAAAAVSVAELLAGPITSVLDVGAGSAVWSIAVAQRHPCSGVTALDLPAVLPVTRRAVTDAGLDDRYRFLAGDMFIRPVGSEYDLILLGNVCHLFDGPTNRKLLRRLRSALYPGGRVAIVDVLPSTDPAQHRAISLYALGLLRRTGTGGVHSADRYERWLCEAGFGPPTIRHVGHEPSISLITAPAVTTDAT